MRKILALVAVVAASVTFAQQPVTAAPHGSIVLRGSGPSFVDITIRETVTVRFPDDFAQHFEASTNGRFVGFAVQRGPGRKVLAGGVAVSAMDFYDGQIPARLTIREAARLTPGTYRFTLLAESTNLWNKRVTATVAIPVQGLAGVHQYVTRGKAPIYSWLGDFRVVPGPPGAIVRHPVETTKRSTVLLAASVESDYGQASLVSACISEPAALCPDDEQPTESNHVSISPGATRSGLRAGRVYEPPDSIPGKGEAQFRMLAAGWASQLTAFVLTIN